MRDYLPTPSTCTAFPLGCKVRVINSGRVFTSYDEMIGYMGLDVKRYNRHDDPLKEGYICTVVGKAMHPDGVGEVLAVEFGNYKVIGLIRALAVVKVEDADPTMDQLKAELVEVKAKLWEAEWKLRKMVEVAQEGIL